MEATSIQAVERKLRARTDNTDVFIVFTHSPDGFGCADNIFRSP